MKAGNILMITGLVIVTAGAVLSMLKIEPWADYILVVGAVAVVLSGSLRMRGK